MSKYYTDTPFDVWLLFEFDEDKKIISIRFSDRKDGLKIDSYLKSIMDAVFLNRDISLFDYGLLKMDKTKKSYKLYSFLISTKKGELFSYSDTAFSVFGDKKYARAVARMLNINPFALIVPCHRIVAKNGIGGFAKGVELKRKILEWEGVNLKGL